MEWHLFLLWALGALAAANGTEARVLLERVDLQGTWTLVSSQDRETGAFTDLGDKEGYYQLRFSGASAGIFEGGTHISTFALDLKKRHILCDRSAISYVRYGEVLMVLQPTDKEGELLRGFTIFPSSLTLVYERDAADSPRVVAFKKENERLNGTWRLIERAPQSNVEAKEGKRNTRLKTSPVRWWPEEYMEYDHPPLWMDIQGRRAVLRDKEGEGKEEVDLWVNPRCNPKRIALGAIGIEYVGSYELKGDLLRIVRDGDPSEEPTVDVWKREK